MTAVRSFRGSGSRSLSSSASGGSTIPVHGIHHVTAIAGDPAENLAFYTRVLGLRLVKRSVNQDAPDTYHLFYADATGSPGTDLTFFPWPAMGPARRGAGQVSEIPLAVPAGALGAWRERLEAGGAAVGEERRRFGERTLPFRDPHDLPLALVGIEEDRAFAPWEESPVPAEQQIRGIHAVRIRVRALAPTARLLEGTLGFRETREDRGWVRYAAGDGSGAYAEVAEDPAAPLARWGTGGVHHVAWRTRDVDEEMTLRAAVERAGLHPTPLIDRFWFRSVYFKEPGGTLFELATDGPGFDLDEDPEHLGETLVLPPWLEPRRPEIEAALPALSVTRRSPTSPRTMGSAAASNPPRG